MKPKKDYTPKHIAPAPDWYLSIEDRYLEAIRQKQVAEQIIDSCRKELESLMSKHALKRIDTNQSSVVVTKSSSQFRIDAKALKNEYPHLWLRFAQPITIPEHLTFTLHDKAAGN